MRWWHEVVEFGSSLILTEVFFLLLFLFVVVSAFGVSVCVCRHILAVMESSLAHFLTWFFTSSSFVQPCHWTRLSSLLHLVLASRTILTLSGPFQVRL